MNKKKNVIVFIGTYPPRECGIATFTQDLLVSTQSVLGENIVCKVAAMNINSVDTQIYPSEVAWKIDQDNKKEYQDLANILNKSANVSGVIIQHEYGIFGGKDGENILSFIQHCKKPLLITLHTVLPNPSDHMRDVTQKIVKRAKNIVVLTKYSQQLLEEIYPESLGKITVVPHGIHASTFSKSGPAKKKLHLAGHTVVSTFGLLSRGKGIEYVLNGLPAVVKKHPDVIYLILGKTHPVVRRKEGEKYRNQLTKLVKDLHLQKHVKFFDQYLTLHDLLQFLQATDIYISTSINADQAVSGTLSYAAGSGRAVISTDFVQSRELITNKIGRVVPTKDSAAYTTALLELLEDPQNLQKMSLAAYEQTRPMLWSRVAQEYIRLLSKTILPPLRLTHLERMTDEFGMFQFAELCVPDKKFGYTIDDNARAAITCSWLLKTGYTKNIQSLLKIYLKFMQHCQQKDGSFLNYIDFEKKRPTAQNSRENLEEANARALWALAELLSNPKIASPQRHLANILFLKALPNANKFLHLRSKAFAIKALISALPSFPVQQAAFSSMIQTNAEALSQAILTHSDKDWYWFEGGLSYNNGVLPQSLFLAGRLLSSQRYLEEAQRTLDFLISHTFQESSYLPIGHSQWFQKGGKRSTFDQQPEDPAAMVMALATAFEVTQQRAYKELADTCFSWFLGNNLLQLSVYNSQTGGCHDGVKPDQLNLNQGAESLVSYLMARITITELHHHENSKHQKPLP